MGQRSQVRRRGRIVQVASQHGALAVANDGCDRLGLVVAQLVGLAVLFLKLLRRARALLVRVPRVDEVRLQVGV